MSRFRLSSAAEADLRAIWAHVAKDRPDAADHLIDDLYERFRLLATQPLLGEGRPEVGEELRTFTVRNYVVVFRPIKTGVEVVRIVHGSRDMPALF